MKIGSSLGLIGIGAILAFAVTATTKFFNINTAGWVLMLVGVTGLLVPRNTAGWLGRRLLVRRTYPGGRIEHIQVPPYVARNPGTARIQAGLQSRPTLLDQDRAADLVQDEESPRSRQETGRQGTETQRTSGAVTEVIEDLYEQP